MKTNLLTWVALCLIFICVGCSVNEPAVTPSATAVSQLTVPTETAVSPTATPEPTPAVMETAVPHPRKSVPSVAKKDNNEFEK